MNGVLYARILLWFGIGSGIALDAAGQGRNGIVWFLLAFGCGVVGFGFLGVVLYLLVRLRAKGSAEPTDRKLEAAVFEARDYIRTEGPVTESEIRAAVYPRYPVGYDDDGNWWATFMQPALDDRAEFERKERGWTAPSADSIDG